MSSHFNHSRLIWSDLAFVLLGVLALYLGSALLFSRAKVAGRSMEPTLSPGEYVLVVRRPRPSIPISRGALAVFPNPNAPGELLIKRVVGIASDVVEIRRGVLFINGQYVPEPYVRERPAYEGLWIVPEGFVFLLGDDRNLSFDSHQFLFVDIADIYGIAAFRYWPIKKAGRLDG